MFFFTELDKLDAQKANQAFGAAAVDGDHNFLVTNKFSIKSGTNAIAYMPLRGSVLVQPQENNLQSDFVNICIKVREQPPASHAPISFIIYRGIRKDSIFDSGGAIKGANTSSLTSVLWRNWQKSRTLPNSTTSANGPSPQDIGWTVNTVAPNIKLERFFGDNEYNLNLPTLDAGHSLGIFADTIDIGIDIILADPLMLPDLDTLYLKENVITIPAGLYSVTNQLPSIRRQREAIMAYVDVSLLYVFGAGLPGVGYWDKKLFALLNNLDDIYNILLAGCQGRNTVYLDLRNETSNSLNHYNEYKNSQDLSSASPIWLSTSAAPVAPYMSAWPWPLYPLVLNGSAVTEVRLAFPTARNPDPLVYREYGELSAALQKTLGKQTIFVSLYNNAYSSTTLSSVISEEITFALPQVQNRQATGLVNICSVIRIMLLRRTVSRNYSDSNAGPVRDNYLDNLFGPIRPLNGLYPRALYAKRWFCQGDLQSGTIVGAIVEPVRTYTDKQVVFTLSVLATYASGALGEPGLAGGRDLTQFGEDVVCRDVLNENPQTVYDLPSKYNLPEFAQDWEKSALGENMARVRLSTATATDVAVLGIWGGKHSPDRALSLAFGREEYDSLALQAAYFDVDAEVYCAFRPFTMELSSELNPKSWQKMVISSTVVLAGFVGNNYHTMTQDEVGQQVRVFSLDSLHFNTAASGDASVLPLQSPPVEDYTVADYLRDLREVETVYQARDERLDQSVTRQRVHHYGFVNEDIPDFDISSPLSSILSMPGGAGGYVFNLDIPRADYWEPPRGLTVSMPNLLLQVPPDGIWDIRWRVRQMYADDPGMSAGLISRLGRKRPAASDIVRGMVRNSTHLIDPGNNIVDLGHTLFTLDALFTYPDVPFPRQSRSRPSNGFESLGIRSGVDLATFIGDISGTLAVSYNQYYNQQNEEFRKKYTIKDYIDATYLLTSPVGDLNSDVDGFGLYEVWDKVFKKAQTTKLSDIIEYFYNDSSDERYSYKSRWKIFCLRNRFVILRDGKYRWEPDMADLESRMDAGYIIGYLAEAEKIKTGFFMAQQGLLFSSYMRGIVHALDPVDRNYVLNKFLTQAKYLLRLEQPNWPVLY